MKINKEDYYYGESGQEIFCNKCGMSCRGHIGNFNGLIEAKVVGAYDSTHIDDGDIYIFSLCERCLKELFDNFHFPAKYGNEMYPELWTPQWNDFSLEEQKQNALHFCSKDEFIEWADTLDKDILEQWVNALLNADPNSLFDLAFERIEDLKELINKKII